MSISPRSPRHSTARQILWRHLREEPMAFRLGACDALDGVPAPQVPLGQQDLDAYSTYQEEYSAGRTWADRYSAEIIAAVLAREAAGRLG